MRMMLTLPGISLAATAAPAQAVVLVPLSALEADLRHQPRQSAAEATAPAPGTIVLPPLIAPHHLYATDTRSHTYFTGWDCSQSFYLRHQSESAAKLRGTEDRKDAEGRSWTRPIEAVLDDFGDLVEVTA